MTQLRIAARTLARSRGFSAIAILSLGLAIALNVVIYSLLIALIDPAVDVRQPEQLHRLRYFGDIHRRLPAGAVESALESGVTAFEGVTGFRPAAIGQESTIEHGGAFREVSPLVVRPNLFDVLGTHAVQGRTFRASDSATTTPIAVLSDRVAAQLFGDGRSPLAETVVVDGARYTVVGVVPRIVVFPGLDTDVWLLPAAGAARAVPISLIRLRSDAPMPLVENELKLLAARLATAAGESPRDTRFYLTADKAERQFHLGDFHWALAAAVLAVLFVACGNLANLQLARGLGRSSELALRSALGATRRDLIATLVLENALLAAGGLVLGLVLSVWGVELVRATIPSAIAGYLVAPRVSWGMFAAALVAALLSLVLVGLLPALRIARVDANALLKSRAGTGAHSRNRRRYAVMVVAQIGLALPLLCGAVLLARSAWRFRSPEFIEHSRIGYNPDPLITASIGLDVAAGRATPVAQLASDLVSRLRALPSVANATITVGRSSTGQAATIETADGFVREVPAPLWQVTLVTPGYFRTMGRTMSSGNDFAEGAYDASEVVMDEPTARFLWPHSNPIGRMIKFGDPRSLDPWMRVIGLVHDLRDTATIRHLDPQSGFHLGSVYRAMTPADSVTAGRGGLVLSAQIRARGDVNRTAIDVRHALWATGGVTSASVTPLDDWFGLTVSRARGAFVAAIFSLFAILGTALVALGVFGIVAHSVNQRRQEFGVRISLGATRGHILRDVLRDGRMVALAGVALGLFATARTMSWLYYFLNGEFDINDAALFASLAAALVATALVAALVPALRATRVDPVEALRNE